MECDMQSSAISRSVYVRDIDLAKRYSVSRNTIWRWSKEGRLPSPVRIGPSVTRWRLDDVEKFERDQGMA